MNQLKRLLENLNSREISLLEGKLASGRGRSRKKYELLDVLLKRGRPKKIETINLLYKDSPNAKENFRKLVKRLQEDVLSIINTRESPGHSLTRVSSTIDSVKQLKTLIENDYGKDMILARFDYLEETARLKHLHLNQIILGRVKCENFYMDICPIELTERLGEVHRISLYVTEAKLFHLSCKRYFLMNELNEGLLERLESMRLSIYKYYVESNEVTVGFYLHAGSFILSLIKQDNSPCQFHLDQIRLLQAKDDLLVANEFSDEFLLLDAIGSYLEEFRNGNIQLHLPDDHVIFSKTFFNRIQSQPFEVDLVLRLLFLSGRVGEVLELLERVGQHNLFESSIDLRRRIQYYKLLGMYLSGEFNEADKQLLRFNTYRNGMGIMRYYIPILKFLINQNLKDTPYDVNIDSFRRYVNRYIRNLNEIEDEPNYLKNVSLKLNVVLKTISGVKRDKNELLELQQVLKEELGEFHYISLHCLPFVKWLEHKIETYDDNGKKGSRKSRVILR
ncbi:hypothetical protein GCM10009118_21280 [Wandonia haliotis]|uniref:Uncharacterized protein n=1 Tax=Wandonia haliotis TaxID=574963 RepID=A0ABP3Y2C9_9FLAO